MPPKKYLVDDTASTAEAWAVWFRSKQRKINVTWSRDRLSSLDLREM